MTHTIPGPQAAPPTNWAGNVRFGAARVLRPDSIQALQTMVRRSLQLRALGTGHSFSPIADTPGDLVSVAGLAPRLDVADDRTSVTVSGGMRHGEIATRLQAEGLALHNLASLPHISVAGAVATGTHGSGIRNGSLSTAVTALEMVIPGGELIRLSREADPERFPGAVVSLGCLGVITALTLRVEPAYQVAQLVYEGLPFATLLTDLDQVLSAGYSVSLFTTWGRDTIDQVWVKRRVDEPGPPLASDWMGARRATRPRHPVEGVSADACTPQLDEPGPWHERLPHFRLDHTPSIGFELQSEYLVPRRSGAEAIRAAHAVGDRVRPVLQVSEIRAIAADDLWLSPMYATDALGLHFTWIDDVARVQPVMAILEDALAPFHARPHWGKLFSMPPAEVQGLYPRLADFRALRQELDPGNRLANELVDRYLGPL